MMFSKLWKRLSKGTPRDLSGVEGEENKIKPDLVICVPGPWSDRSDFLKQIVVSTEGAFIFAGGILANPNAKDHVALEIYDHDPDMKRAFEIAGKGLLEPALLDKIAQHKTTAYLHFPLDVLGQKERLLRFTSVLQQIGGLGIKIESAGIAHSWDNWLEILKSKNSFDQYRSFVTLIGDKEHFYSCGMHNFGLPDCQISREFEAGVAAALMNRFNYYQIDEKPDLKSGHTFSLTTDGEWFRLNAIPDQRHDDVYLFKNPHGLWDMKRMTRPK